MRQPKKRYLVEYSAQFDPHYIDPISVRLNDEKTGVSFELNIEAYTDHSTIARALLGSACRLYVSTTESYLRGVWRSQRRFFAFLHREKICDSVDSLNRELLESYLQYLKRQKLGARTKHQSFMRTQALVREAGRCVGRSIESIQNPFPGVGSASSPRDHLTRNQLVSILNAAKKDVRAVWDMFEGHNDSPALAKAIRYVKEKYGGVIPTRLYEHDWDFKKICAAAGGISALEKRLYATPDTIVPFLILIGYSTAANIDSLCSFERECVFPDDLIQGHFHIRWWKGRARIQQSVMRAGIGFFSAPSLISKVSALTEPIVPHVSDRWQNRLFLVISRGNARRYGPVTPTIWSDGLIRFIRRHNLRDASGDFLTFNFSMLRPSVLAEVYRKTRNVVAVKRFANHRNLDTTWRYVVDRVTDDMHDQAVSQAQRRMYRAVAGRKSTARDASIVGGRAKSAMRDCADPMNPPRPSPRHDLCPSWLWPLNDPGLVIPDDPKNVAELLRQRDSLRAAQSSMIASRFDKIYAPILRIIEVDLLPKFSKTTLAQAESLAKVLPPLPVFADE